MKIEFGVQEYFNELKLIDAQHEQEEELYPWVYMLLQMAECRKKEILKEWYQGVSIRDVHKAVQKKDNELIKLLRQKKGFPDHVILERKYGEYKILGCSEIKNKEINLIKKQYNIVKFLTPTEYNVEFYFNKKDISKNIKEILNEKDDNNIEKYRKEIDDNNDYVKEVDEQIEKAITKVLTSASIDAEYINWGKMGGFHIHRENTRSYCVKLEEKNVDKIDGLKRAVGNLNCLIEEDENKTIAINENVRLNLTSIEITENEWDFEIELKDAKLSYKEKAQLLSHLEKFKKVLYTNGLEFYYLVLNKKKIDVKKIADLQPMYAEYKENTTPSPQLLLEASAEWDRLIVGLTSIDWHQPPVAEIPSI